jgi:hypothetical protein
VQAWAAAAWAAWKDAAAEEAAPAAAADDDDGDDEEEDDAAAAASRKAPSAAVGYYQKTSYYKTHFHKIKAVNQTDEDGHVIEGSKPHIYGMYDTVDDEGDRIYGPAIRVGSTSIDGVGARFFDLAVARLAHPHYASDPWISLGCGSKTVARFDNPISAAHHSQGWSPQLGVDDGGRGSETAAIHVDENYHCMDGSVYNLLRFRFPHFADKVAARLADDEFKRMQFSEMATWFESEIPRLQCRHIAADDMLAHLRSKVLNEITELIVVETTGNGHCIAADTGLNQMSDVASGKIAMITTDDVLAQLGETGLCKHAMVIELKDVPEPQPVRNRKRRGKNATRAQKSQKKRQCIE